MRIGPQPRTLPRTKFPKPAKSTQIEPKTLPPPERSILMIPKHVRNMVEAIVSESRILQWAKIRHRKGKRFSLTETARGNRAPNIPRSVPFSCKKNV